MRDIIRPAAGPHRGLCSSQVRALVFTTGDLLCLVGLWRLLFAGSLLAWRSAPSWRVATAAAGSLVILESWFTALGFLHRTRPLRLKLRWLIFLAAIVPWLVGLGVAVSAMLMLFWISDRYSS